MGDASFKHGSFQARFVYVGVEMVATHVRELNDVRFGDGVFAVDGSPTQAPRSAFETREYLSGWAAPVEIAP